MKVTNYTKVAVLSKVAKQGIKDPSKKYYSLVVMQDEDAGAISCSEEVFNAVTEQTTSTLVTEFNEKYGSFRAIGVVTGKQDK